jgi:hypothetical protein
MSDDKESLNATVASLRQAARHLIASIDTTPDREHKRLLALQAFQMLAQLVGYDCNLVELRHRLKCRMCGAQRRVRVETMRPGDR